MIDLVLCKDKFDNLEFSKVYEIKIDRVNSINQIKKLNNELNIVEGGSLNREVLSSKNIDILVSPEKNRKEDFLHHRNSGLNQVLCNLAKKNKVVIGFSFNEVLKSKDVERAKIIGRMQQNIKLCRKYKVDMIIASFATNKYEMRSLNDLKSFARVIGMNSQEVKKVFTLANDILKRKKEYITDGIKILKT
jgi:RNase P/RNase MRP subunit p30|tara:strand:+ start:853 stop:1425 length:573 start_codon:yes stop_codon:yes gene_type:complete